MYHHEVIAITRVNVTICVDIYVGTTSGSLTVMQCAQIMPLATALLAIAATTTGQSPTISSCDQISTNLNQIKTDLSALSAIWRISVRMDHSGKNLAKPFYFINLC